MSSVSRSVYQRLAEENKKLLHDIYILTETPDHRDTTKFMAKMDVVNKWRAKFKQDKEFNEMLRDLLINNQKS